MSTDQQSGVAEQKKATATFSVPRGVAELYRLVWQSARGVRGQFCAALALQAVGFSLAIAPPYLLGKAVFVAQVSQGKDLSGMLGWLGLIPVAMLVMWVFNGPGRILERRVAVDVQRNLVAHLSDRALSVPVRWHEGRHSGDTTGRIDTTVRAVVAFAESQSFYLKSTFNLAGAAVVLTLICWPIGLLALLGFGTLTFWTLNFDGQLTARLDEHTRATNRLTASLSDTLGNITTIKALGASRGAHRTIMGSMRAVEVLARAIVVPMERKWWIITYGSGALTAALLAGYSWISWQQAGVVQAGYLVMIAGYAATLQTSFEIMGGHGQALVQFQADGRSADELRSAVADVTETGKVPDDWSEVVVRELTLTHPGRVEGADEGGQARSFGVRVRELPIRRGERIALVGSSGSGKSTLLRALAGMYRCDTFTAEVDGQLAADIQSLSSMSGFLPQDVEIFETTLRHNIDLGTDADPARLAAAADRACLRAVMSELPDGMDTNLVERGVNLSGGQKQRVGVARGLLLTRDCSLLLLDEPTSSLDPITESTVYGNIIAALPGVTIISAIHRLHLLKFFDTVILMKDGDVIDRGSPERVIQRQPELRLMVQATTSLEQSLSVSAGFAPPEGGVDSAAAVLVEAIAP